MLESMWRLISISALCASLAFAQGKGAGRAKPHPARGAEPAHAAEAPRKAEPYPSFRDAEIRLIQDFYRPGSGHLPPGIARKGEFPPGILKQLERGKGLPPGLEKMLEPFPPGLARQFPPPPPGYRRMLCGNFALLLKDGTNLVVDIVHIGQ